MREAAYREAERRWWSHWGVTTTDRWLELDRPRTRVRMQELGEGAPLLFVHGGPAAGSIFAPLASQLRDFRCLVLDRPGCGMSPPINYSHTPHDVTMPEVLRACLDALGLDRVDLVASSFGGSCAFWFAQRYPDRVGHIVLMGCPAFVEQMQTPFFLRLLATPGVGAVVARLPANRSATRSLLKAMGQHAALKERRVPEAFFRWWISLGRDTDTMVHERDLVRHGLTWKGMRPHLVLSDEALQAIPHPTYVYWGADDPVADPHYAVRLFSGLPRGKVDVVPGSGHLPWFDDTAGAAQRIRDFVRPRVETRPGAPADPSHAAARLPPDG